MCSVLSPGSVLLSGNGSLAFKSCARYEDVASFTAPEIQQGQAASTRTSAEKVRASAMSGRWQLVSNPGVGTDPHNLFPVSLDSAVA